jgi:hypothetical protein
MKRKIFIITAIVVTAFTCYSVLAQPEKGQMSEDMKMMTEKGKQMDTAMMSCPMCPMMCKSMMDSKVVATEDGGVVLMAGCKLIKYDKDLNKVKEVPVEIDMKAIQAKMQEAMKNCPMCQNMMKMKSSDVKMD